jgi:hypothetical protein
MRNLTIVGLLLLSVFAKADFKESYKDGVRAAGSANWAVVEAKMREALASEPNPQAKVRLYGMRFEPYLPHHYLALAAAARGNCQAALTAINNSAHQSALNQAKEGAALKAAETQIKSKCQSTPSAPTLPTPPVNVPTAPTTVPNAPVVSNTKPANAPPANTPSAPVSRPATTPTTEAPVVAKLSVDQINRVRQSLRTVANHLSTARVNYAKPELSAQAQAAQAELAAIDAQAKAQTATLNTAIANNDANALTRLNADTQNLVARALRARTSAISALASVAPVARQPAPTALAQIATLYFAGNLAKAAVANVDGLSGKSLAHALILRSAAKHAIYVSQGESKAEQLNSVREDLQSAKRADASVRPSAKYFSPTFTALY